MVKKYLKKVIILIPTLASLILVSFFWDNINFKFINPNEIIGYYSLFNHSHWNDNIRYIVFIGLPLITYFITLILKDKITINQIKCDLLLTKNYKNQNEISKFYLFFLIFF